MNTARRSKLEEMSLRRTKIAMSKARSMSGSKAMSKKDLTIRQLKCHPGQSIDEDFALDDYEESLKMIRQFEMNARRYSGKSIPTWIYLIN